LLLVFLVLGGCGREPAREPPRTGAFHLLQAGQLPQFVDDLDPQSLKVAIARSLSFLDRSHQDQSFPLGDRNLSAEDLRATLNHFQGLLESGGLNSSSIARSFDVYWATSAESPRDSLITGYYEPILEGCAEHEQSRCHPIYGVPSDLVTVELAAFETGGFPVERLVGRLDGRKIVPYFSRAQIDGENKLARTAQPVAWVRDAVAAYFLHVQGSGIVQMPDGRILRLGYAGSNGHPYKSIGKVLIDRGILTRDTTSLQSIRDTLRQHPEYRDEVMWQNPSYVFFRQTENGPNGSLNVPLTEGRSIATDSQLHPRGGLAFLETTRPRLDQNGQPVGQDPLRRWVLNQDTGGAIKGAGRTDLFCGTGEEAEQLAGHMKQPGKLYFLVKKKGHGSR
jgi:membrane-bound lytic murein transglycosylase A